MVQRRSLTVIHFKSSSVYLSIPNSLIICPLHRFFLESVSSFSMSESLDCLLFLKDYEWKRGAGGRGGQLRLDPGRLSRVGGTLSRP